MRDTERDAARYRWLIEGDNAWRVMRFGPCDPTEFVAIGPGLEHAIDAAMRRDELEEKSLAEHQKVLASCTDGSYS